MVLYRGGSVCLNRFRAFLKWFSALVMRLPRLKGLIEVRLIGPEASWEPFIWTTSDHASCGEAGYARPIILITAWAPAEFDCAISNGVRPLSSLCGLFKKRNIASSSP